MNDSVNSEVLRPLDDIDWKIINLLRADGIMSNREIARRSKTTVATVQARLKRLEDSNVMRVVVITDFVAAGYELLLAVGVQTESCPVEEVANDLARFPEVFAVNLVTGTHDIEMLVAVKGLEDLSKFLKTRVDNVKGIKRLTPALTVDVLKYETDWVPLVYEQNNEAG